jgi:dTDP-4-amino-4,6-dideoxygalactose transaminase
LIQFLDLKKINEPYESAFKEKLDAVLNKGWYVLGDEVKQFETSFAKYCGAEYCVGVGNGLDALTLIFKGYIQLGKLKKGDEVIVPANTYIATILAILQADLVPVLVEPKLENYTINPVLIEAKITSKTKAILVVHLYGQLAEMAAINAIANQNNLLIVEDAAQAHGSIKNHDSSVAYSFYPSKNLGSLGDGGAVTTNNSELANAIRLMRNYGSDTKYYNECIGLNSRLDELQAAFLNVKLPNLDIENEQRRVVAKRYLNEIINDKIVLPNWGFSNNHVFHLFVIRTQDRADLQNYLYQKGIQTAIHYPVPPHKQKALSEWNKCSFPITEKIHNEVLSLPLNPVLTEDEVDFIIATLNTY